MATLAQIYDWFMTSKKPTQAQFWATWSSFYNKNEPIPQSSISGLTEVLNAKTENDQFNAHKTDTSAHADLFNAKEDKSQKGVAGGYAPLNDYIKLASQYLDIVDDLTTGGSSSLASAETVKTLKTQITAINTLLTSNDINLDTVQELVDAIKTVQTSISTILVNDLTTGGTTKALTAEMGKSLKALYDSLSTNKVDKAAGERLINAAEITKLSSLTNIITTVKSILSTALSSQDVAGFVTYLNALTPVLVVGANEIVEYKTTDTGRVFKLLLRGRSFGVGQAAIVAADVIESTEFLSKDIKLSNYPSTRNDGQILTNKVLGTDVNGNLKMYTIATAPAPYLNELIPDSYLPSTTGNFILKGAFFTPAMTVVINGQTVNYTTFINDNEVHANVTTGAAEGRFNVTLNNGLSATFNNALLIVLGTVYKPILTDWTNLTGSLNVDTIGEAHLKVANNLSTGKWQKLIPAAQNFKMLFYIDKSPLIASSPVGSFDNRLCLIKVSDSSIVYGAGVYGSNYGNPNFLTYLNNAYVDFTNYTSGIYPIQCEIRRVSGEVFVYLNGVLQRQFVTQAQVDMYIQVRITSFDITNIKYVETT
ncbi:hypothetical protein [Flavobacterium aestivum]|uniref:hypothetical protein n=1 Tax=Flavobacterium aestivum TaxID=3003257 RepID=UPI002482A3F0|nr:hypothetical protein [Flavobacterium aestivum]